VRAKSKRNYLCLSHARVPIPPAVGRSLFTTPMRSAVTPGKTPWKSVASCAGRESTNSASPRLHALMICRAARSAFMEVSGSASLMLNHAYSARCFPLNSALRGLPVRISPGQIVVTTIPSLASSEWSPSDNPTKANLLALYGHKTFLLDFH
jgi:hypothetical protein